MEQSFLVILTTAIVQILKSIPMPKWGVQLLALVIGVVLAQVNKVGVESILPGIVIGLSATGLYEATIRVTNKVIK